jgi:hypothetical protein
MARAQRPAPRVRLQARTGPVPQRLSGCLASLHTVGMWDSLGAIGYAAVATDP